MVSHAPKEGLLALKSFNKAWVAIARDVLEQRNLEHPRHIPSRRALTASCSCHHHHHGLSDWINYEFIAFSIEIMSLPSSASTSCQRPSASIVSTVLLSHGPQLDNVISKQDSVYVHSRPKKYRDGFEIRLERGRSQASLAMRQKTVHWL